MLAMCFADDFTGGHIERGKQRSGAMTEILAGRPLGGAAAQGQDGLCSLQRLTLAFFIQAKHDCILRRAHVETHHIAHLVQKLRGGGELKVLMAVRLQPEGFPDPGDAVVREPQFAGQ